MRAIEILDTTLRDGEQTHNVAYSPAEKLQIAKILLEKVNVDRVEIASARISKGEEEGVKQIVEWAKKNNFSHKLEVLALVDKGKSIEWLKKTGVKTMNLLTKGSLKHLELQLGKKPETHFNDIAEVLKEGEAQEISANIYLEDWSNGYRDDRAYVYDIIQFLSETKTKRIMLPDTLGVMYPSNLRAAFEDLTERFPDIHFDFHPHNDYGLGTINVLEAIQGGARGVHLTVNCLGERTGNASLAEVIAGIHDHLRLKTNINENALFNVSRVVETFSGKRLAANAPIVGEDVFTQTAGIHADGDKKAGLYQSALQPKRFGRKRSYSLGKMSGKASLLNNLKDIGIELSEENKTKVLQKIIDLGDQKRIITPEDLPFIIADVLKRPIEKKVKFKNVIITSGQGINPVCSMTLFWKNQEHRVVGHGHGGYDAFVNALRSWSEQVSLSLPMLLDYEVRIPPGGKTSALVECKITWQYKGTTDNKEKTIITRGVNADQVMAAVSATEKMLNLVLSA